MGCGTSQKEIKFEFMSKFRNVDIFPHRLKPMLPLFISFVIYGNFWIAMGALCSVFVLSYLLQIPVSETLYGLVFFGTLCTYQLSFFALKTAHSDKYKIPTEWVFFFKITCVFSALVSAFFLLYCSVYQVLTICILGIISVWYSFHVPFLGALRLFPFQKTLWVAIVWAGATVVLPFGENLIDVPKMLLGLFVARFLWVWALCLPFDARDSEADRAVGLRTFYNTLSRKNYLLFSNTILLGSFFTHLYYFPQYWHFFLFLHLGLAITNFFAHEKRPEWYFTGLIDGFLVFEVLLVWV